TNHSQRRIPLTTPPPPPMYCRPASALSRLFEHPNVLMGHPQPGVGTVSHPGSLDRNLVNEPKPLPLHLLSVPLRHPDNLASPNVVFDVDDKHTAASQHPDALGPNTPVSLPVRFAPLHLPRVRGVQGASQDMAVGVSPRPVTGIVVVGHAVPIGGARHDGIKLAVTRPRHVCRVAYVHLDVCRCLCGPFRLDLVSHNAPSETVITEQANFPDACHRIKNALRPVSPKDTGEDRQEHVSVLGRMSWWHGRNRHNRHLTYETRPAWARS